MKFLLCLFFLPACAVLAQSPPAGRARTFIPGVLEVPAFTPPVPAERKVLPLVRAEASLRLPATSGHTLTVTRAAPSTLPDLPPPVENLRETPPNALSAEARAAMERHYRQHLLLISATVYDHSTSIIHWRHPDTGENYEARCGFDVSLLAGIGTFTHDGEAYQLMLAHININTDAMRRLLKRATPPAPFIPRGEILITRGNPADPAATAPLFRLRDLIASEEPRLVAYQAQRQRHQAAYSAWLEKNPPVSRDETVLLRPHRGSRYLTGK